jgi:2-pyrone-4,6-dicarboxylate lactonase
MTRHKKREVHDAHGSAPGSLPSAYLDFDRSPKPREPRFPPGACDCHFHVFEDPERYPLATERSYTPTLATLDDYRRMADAFGLQRGVLVHPSVYGRDHATFEHALAANPGWLRGVAVVYPDTPDETLARWHDLGCRGSRVNALFKGGAALDDLPSLADRVRPLGWHLQLLIDIGAEPDLLGRLATLGLPLVVDHFGHLPASGALQSPGFANLLALVRDGQVWVKLSGHYRISPQRAGFDDVRPLAESLAAAAPGQLVWGSDWPHPAISPPMVNDGVLADTVHEWFDEPLRRRILIDNPSRLYWADAEKTRGR